MKKRLFDRESTLMLHGLAILMMIYHHLFITGNTRCINYGISLFDIFDGINLGSAETAQMTVAWFCKICVAVFAFTSGYGMYIQLDKKYGRDSDFKKMYEYCFERLFSFYKKFLLCFLFFTGYEYFSGNHSGFDYSLLNYILNLIGLRSSYNATWWYVSVYYCMVLLSPIIFSVLNGKIKLKYVLLIFGMGCICLIGVLCYAYAINDFSHYLTIFKNLIQSALVVYLTIFIEGMICSKYDILEKLASKMNFISATALLIVTFIARALLIRIPGDSVFDVVLTIPFVLSVSVLFLNSKYLKKVLIFIGKYSAYMWYCHPYFYAYLFFSPVNGSTNSFRLIWSSITSLCSCSRMYSAIFFSFLPTVST